MTARDVDPTQLRHRARVFERYSPSQRGHGSDVVRASITDADATRIGRSGEPPRSSEASRSFADSRRTAAWYCLDITF